jgi:hypothetical protein
VQTTTSRPGRRDGTPNDAVAVRALLETLAYSRERDYTGWDYCDGLSSRILRALPVQNRWVNLAFQETAKRAPVNVRPLLLVEQRRNFMGAGLFAMANLTADRLLDEYDIGAVCGSDVVGDPTVDYAGEALDLLDWLVANRCRGYSGFCGSHQHRTQSLTNTGDTTMPSVVSTAFPARALLRAGDLDPVFSAVGETAAEFVVEDLAYREVEGGAVIKYLPKDDWEYVTPNAMAVGAALLVDLSVATGDRTLAERAGRILDYVAGLQTDAGGWYYRYPPDESHLSMDNFHNGFIIEAMLRYDEAVDGDRYADVLDRALSFYRGKLFDANGAPNWDESSPYPRDVHASAQGIIVFSRAGEFERARQILAWTLENFSPGDGRFYFRSHRFYTKRITLMRWCQAWMAFAISEYLARRYFNDPPL